jgi:diguanylate cyclase (GGDEF)-like protein
LRLFGRTLRSTFRSDDIVGRYGGEEFIVLIPGISAEGAVQVVEGLRAQLVEALAKGNTPSFTASFGVADSTQAEALEDVIEAADEALYAAKRAGRDRILLAGPPPLPAADGRDPSELARLVATEEAGD